MVIVYPPIEWPRLLYSSHMIRINSSSTFPFPLCPLNWRQTQHHRSYLNDPTPHLRHSLYLGIPINPLPLPSFTLPLWFDSAEITSNNNNNNFIITIIIALSCSSPFWLATPALSAPLYQFMSCFAAAVFTPSRPPTPPPKVVLNFLLPKVIHLFHLFRSFLLITIPQRINFLHIEPVGPQST